MDYSWEYCKCVVMNNIIVITLLIFAVVYFIINHDKMNQTHIFTGELYKSILITIIIVLLLYIGFSWENTPSIILENPDVKYRIINNNNVVDNSNINTNTLGLGLNRRKNLTNENVFVSRDNLAKFGIQF